VPGYSEIPPVDYEWLLELERKNKPSFIPPGLTDEINLREVLKGIESETIRFSKNQDIASDREHKYKRVPRKEVSKEIFISYSWTTESKEIADQLEATFQAKGIQIMRDISQMKYKDRIQEFMQNIGRGKCVIVIISQAYLQSQNCMFELLEIAKNGDFRDRIFPIVLPSAKIYDSEDRIEYVQYWEQKITKLDEAMKTVSSANLQGFREDIDLYSEIRDSFSQLTNILKDMNTLTTATHSESGFAEFVESKLSDFAPQVSLKPKFPQTPLAQKLWKIRQRAIANGLQLLNEDEIESELATRRGGLRQGYFILKRAIIC